MMNCWQNEPQARPSFTALTKQLKDMENQHKVRSVSEMLELVVTLLYDIIKILCIYISEADLFRA